jgi:proton-dependent oligopeptide transporter, POT family
MTQAAHASTGSESRGFFGHPRGLATLFFTEMWERFSYYGMRGVLILFMVDAIQTGGLGMDVPKAAAIYGLYTAGVYLMALPGGWVADRIAGARNAVFYGGILIAGGQFTLALAATTLGGFYLGLALIILGTGLLKPNVSAIVGDLYPEGGGRRDAGFSIFYMGINIGAFVGPLICGFLGETIAWKWAFTAAGVGMVAGLIQYKMGAGLSDLGAAPKQEPAERSQAIRSLGLAASGVVVAGLIIFWLQRAGITAISLQQAAGATGVVIVSLAIVYFAYHLLMGPWTSVEKKRLVVIFFLFIGAALFWSGFEQAGSSMNLFAADLTNRVLLGWEAPASWLQSVNPIFIIIFAPVFGWLWVALGTRNPSIPVKFGTGLVLLGMGFLVMAWASVYASPTTPVSPMWLVVTYFLHTSGELCLSPVGLSSITKLSPKPLVGQMMGIWFMGASLGNLIAGLVAGQMATLPLVQLFGTVAAIVIGSGILFILFKGPIQRLSPGVE